MRNDKPKYEKYKKMIALKAYRVHLRTGHDVEDLKSEGCVIFLTARERWCPERSSFSTFLWRSLDRELWDYVQHFSRYQHDELDEAAERVPSEDHRVIERIVVLDQELARLSPTAHYMIALITTSDPSSILGLGGNSSAQSIREALRRHLYRIHDHGTVRKSMAEIRNTLRQIPT